MEKIYTNKVKIKLSDEILNDFDIFNIRFVDPKKRFNIVNVLSKFSNKIFAIQYINNFSECLILAKYDVLPEKQLKDEIDIISPCAVRKINRIYSDDITDISNLLLLFSIYSEGKIICANSLKMIVDIKKNSVICLCFEFLEDLLICKLETYTILKSVSSKYKDKPKYIKHKNVLIRVDDETKYKDDEMFIYHNPSKTRNTLSVFSAGPELEKTKTKIISDVYKMISENEYFVAFDFDFFEMSSLQDDKTFFKKKKDCEEFEQYTIKYCKNITNLIGLNLIYESNKRKISEFDIIKDFFSKIGIFNIKCTDEPSKDNFNLILLEENEKNEDIITNSDILYNAFDPNIYIIQHLGINDFNSVNTTTALQILQTCINNLVIKYEVSQKVIQSFDWSVFNKHSKSKFYIFYAVVDNSVELIPYKCKIYQCGKIEFSEGDIFSEDFDEVSVSSFVVEDDKGNKIKIIDQQNLYALPNINNFIESCEALIGGRAPLPYEFYNSFITSLNSNDLELIKMPVNYIKKYFPDVLDISLFDKKIELNIILKNIKNECSVKEIKDFKLLFQTFLNEKYSKNIKFISDFKTTSKGDMNIFTAIKNIHYNDNYYVVPPCSACQVPVNLVNNMLFRRIEVLNGNNFFDEIILMLINPIVKLNSCTVYPFIIKYIREYALMQAKSKS